MSKQPITQFINDYFLHFNAAALKDAAQGYQNHLAKGGKMFLAMAGAMSSAELGKTLAEMIRQDKVHAISCTGANLEEDLYNLIAHDHYKRVPHYRDLTPQQEQDLLERNLNRVTDTCIPEEEAMRRLERPLIDLWKAAEDKGDRKFPHEFIFELLRSELLKEHYQIDPKDSWVFAAAKKDIPIFVPGWEDSTLGNNFTANILKGIIQSPQVVRCGVEYMIKLTKWYRETSSSASIGFFQIGGGIAGDFPICVVPMIHQDMKQDCPLWGYFCQVSDSTTSYGSYSGAVPNEKITWGKLGKETPKFIIESDATIVVPLIFAYLLGW